MEAGLATPEGARRYGVVLDAEGAVDVAASMKLRAGLAKRRGPVQVFDRGFKSMDEIKSGCLAETAFAPPLAPRFTNGR